MADYYATKKRKKRSGYRIGIVIFGSLLIFLGSFVMYMRDTTLEDYLGIETTPSVTEPTVPDVTELVTEPTTVQSQEPELPVTSEVTEPSSGNPVGESEAVDDSYFDDCIFVGDSITYGLGSYNKISAKNVYASVGMNISKIDTTTVETEFGEMTVIEALKLKKPQYVYIMLGSNGIYWLSNDAMIKMYSSFIDEIKAELPQTEIIVLSIPPVTADREVASESPIKNSDIDSYNDELLKMANDKNVHFVDTHSCLVNSEGKLDTDMAAGDGYHFQADTYDIFLNYIKTHTVK